MRSLTWIYKRNVDRCWTGLTSTLPLKNGLLLLLGRGETITPPCQC